MSPPDESGRGDILLKKSNEENSLWCCTGVDEKSFLLQGDDDNEFTVDTVCLQIHMYIVQLCTS